MATAPSESVSHSEASSSSESEHQRISFRMTAAKRFWIGALVFLLLTILALKQSPRPNAMESPQWMFSSTWWGYPLEWN
ncbi:MAG: hypothetical protein DMF69_22750, partial [Acidobacteria bacterium]